MALVVQLIRAIRTPARQVAADLCLAGPCSMRRPQLPLSDLLGSNAAVDAHIVPAVDAQCIRLHLVRCNGAMRLAKTWSHLDVPAPACRNAQLLRRADSAGFGQR